MSFVFEHRSSDSPLVEAIWRTQSTNSGSFTSTAETRSEMVVIKHQGKFSVTVRGPETKASLASFPPDAEFFGITFKLGTFMPHLLPKNLLDRRDVTLPEAASHAIWLQGSAWQIPDFENADTFVNRLVREDLLIHDPLVNAVLQGQHQDLSLRAVQYHFVRATGLTQNTIRQIERAQRATRLLKQGLSILDTVYEMGYFDQAHLTRSLKRFVGQTPVQVVGFRQPD